MEAKLTKRDKQLRTPIQNKDGNHVMLNLHREIQGRI